MSVTLPAAISAYFAADRNNGDAAALCFTENAVVVDERRTHSGRDAIRQWKAEASEKYSYVVDPFAVTEDNNQILVTAHLTGSFPGSPLDLRYKFVLDDDKIAHLEIAP